MGIGNALPKKVELASETRDGLMSSKDKKTLNKLVKQMADLIKTISSISSDKIKHSSEDIMVNGSECGKVVMVDGVVTLNINMTVANSNEPLFTLPKNYIPSKAMLYTVAITRAGTLELADMIIRSDGVVLIDSTYSENIFVNTSVSYIK